MENWDNSLNIQYYEQIPFKDLQEFAIKGGIENGCDIDLAYPYIRNAKSLLEVGAAYGRVVENLLGKGYLGRIYAIERSKNLFKVLQQNCQKKAILINNDIQNYNPPEKMEAIMWMWSSISDFPKKHQNTILKRLMSWLTETGVLVLETISHTTIPRNVSVYNQQSYIAESLYGKAYGYIPSSQEIEQYSKEIGFSKIHQIPYTTSTDRQRILHILQK